MWLPWFFSSSKAPRDPNGLRHPLPPVSEKPPKAPPVSKPPMTALPDGRSLPLWTPRPPVALPSRANFYPGMYGGSFSGGGGYQPKFYGDSYSISGGGGEYASEPMEPVYEYQSGLNPDPARFLWDDNTCNFVPYWVIITGGGGDLTRAKVEVPPRDQADGSVRTHPAYAVWHGQKDEVTLDVVEGPDIARFQEEHSLAVVGLSTVTLNAVYLHATRRCCPEPKPVSPTEALREQRKAIWEEARKALDNKDMSQFDEMRAAMEILDDRIKASFAVPDTIIGACSCGYIKECSVWCGDGHKTGECGTGRTQARRWYDREIAPSGVREFPVRESTVRTTAGIIIDPPSLGPDWHEVTTLGENRRHWINVHTSEQYWEK